MISHSQHTAGFLESSPASFVRFSVTARTLVAVLCALDFVAILLSSLGIGIVSHLIVRHDIGDLQQSLGIGLLVGLIFFAVQLARAAFPKAYGPFRMGSIRELLTSWALAFLVASAIIFALKAGDELSRGAMFCLFAFGFPAILLTRHVAAHNICQAIARHSSHGKRVVLIGDRQDIHARDLSNSLASVGFDVVDVLDCVERGESGSIWRSAAEISSRLAAAIRRAPIEVVHIVCPIEKRSYVNDIAHHLSDFPVQIVWGFDQTTNHLLSQPFTQVGPFPGVELQRPPLSLVEWLIKRGLDIFVASFALAALSPLMACVALIIRLESKGPVVFRQQRKGFGGRPFTIYKFRSMRVMEDGAVVQQAQRGDPRVTSIGQIIRRTSIDELPQLFNVLNGDMSLVGPRPHAVAHDNEYMRYIEDYSFRHHMKPGLTGWAQVHGLRGETQTVELMRQRVELDIWYVNNWTPWLDVKILCRTLGIVLFQKNAF